MIIPATYIHKKLIILREARYFSCTFLLNIYHTEKKFHTHVKNHEDVCLFIQFSRFMCGDSF
jgi:hypothetical protein